MLVKRKLRGFHLTGTLRPLLRKHLERSDSWGGSGWFLLKQHRQASILATTEVTLPCPLAHQTQFKMWCRSWRNNTWKRSGVLLRSSGSCMSGSWSSSASSSPRRGSPRAVALAAWPTARQLSRRWPSGQRRGKNGTRSTRVKDQGCGALRELVRHVKEDRPDTEGNLSPISGLLEIGFLFQEYCPS